MGSFLCYQHVCQRDFPMILCETCIVVYSRCTVYDPWVIQNLPKFQYISGIPDSGWMTIPLICSMDQESRLLGPQMELAFDPDIISRYPSSITIDKSFPPNIELVSMIQFRGLFHILYPSINLQCWIVDLLWFKCLITCRSFTLLQHSPPSYSNYLENHRILANPKKLSRGFF